MTLTEKGARINGRFPSAPTSASLARYSIGAGAVTVYRLGLVIVFRVDGASGFRLSQRRLGSEGSDQDHGADRAAQGDSMHECEHER